MNEDSTTVITGPERRHENIDVRTINFSASFLGNARLYALAVNCGVESLRELALSNIEHVYDFFTDYTDGYEGPRDSFVELAEFVFSDHNYPAKADDGLRASVLYYLMIDFEWIGWTRGYVRMLKKGGAFAKSFWAQALQQI